MSVKVVSFLSLLLLLLRAHHIPYLVYRRHLGIGGNRQGHIERARGGTDETRAGGGGIEERRGGVELQQIDCGRDGAANAHPQAREGIGKGARAAAVHAQEKLPVTIVIYLLYIVKISCKIFRNHMDGGFLFYLFLLLLYLRKDLSATDF